MKIFSEYKENKIGWYSRNMISSEAIRFIKHLEKVEGKKFILEIGSGSGADTEFFSSNNFYILSSDILRSNKTVNLICDGKNLPFKHNTVANIYTRGVLHLFITKHYNVLNDLITMLSPSGILFATYYLTISDGYNNKTLASKFNGDERVTILSESTRKRTHWNHSHIIYEICLQKKKEFS